MVLSVDFFLKINFLKNIFQEHYMNQIVKRFGSRSGPTFLIWVQTVCKGYQGTTKIAASMHIKRRLESST